MNSQKNKDAWRDDSVKCQSLTRKSEPCRRKHLPRSRYCWWHAANNPLQHPVIAGLGIVAAVITIGLFIVLIWGLFSESRTEVLLQELKLISKITDCGVIRCTSTNTMSQNHFGLGLESQFLRLNPTRLGSDCTVNLCGILKYTVKTPSDRALSHVVCRLIWLSEDDLPVDSADLVNSLERTTLKSFGKVMQDIESGSSEEDGDGLDYTHHNLTGGFIHPLVDTLVPIVRRQQYPIEANMAFTVMGFQPQLQIDIHRLHLSLILCNDLRGEDCERLPSHSIDVLNPADGFLVDSTFCYNDSRITILTLKLDTILVF